MNLMCTHCKTAVFTPMGLKKTGCTQWFQYNPPPPQPGNLVTFTGGTTTKLICKTAVFTPMGPKHTGRTVILVIVSPPPPQPTLLHLQAVVGGCGVYTNELDVQALLNSCTYSHGFHRVCDTFSMHSTPADLHMALTLLSLSCHTGSGSCSNVTRFTPHSLNQ